MGAASAVGLTVSVIRAIIHGGRSLLTHCRFPDAIGYSSITNECPFDPTRIYVSTPCGWWQKRRPDLRLQLRTGLLSAPDLMWNKPIRKWKSLFMLMLGQQHACQHSR